MVSFLASKPAISSLFTALYRSLILHELKDRGEGRGVETLLHLRFRGKIAATGLKRKAIVWGGGVLDHFTTLPMMAGLKERAEKGWEDIQAKKR